MPGLAVILWSAQQDRLAWGKQNYYHPSIPEYESSLMQITFFFSLVRQENWGKLSSTVRPACPPKFSKNSAPPTGSCSNLWTMAPVWWWNLAEPSVFHPMRPPEEAHGSRSRTNWSCYVGENFVTPHRHWLQNGNHGCIGNVIRKELGRALGWLPGVSCITVASMVFRVCRDSDRMQSVLV